MSFNINYNHIHNIFYYDILMVLIILEFKWKFLLSILKVTTASSVIFELQIVVNLTAVCAADLAIN